MSKMKSLLDQFDEAKIISNDDLKKVKGGAIGFLYNFMRVGYVCRFCSKDNKDS